MLFSGDQFWGEVVVRGCRNDQHLTEFGQTRDSLISLQSNPSDFCLQTCNSVLTKLRKNGIEKAAILFSIQSGFTRKLSGLFKRRRS